MPLRPAQPPAYYHQKFRRVPTVEECYEDDVVCIFEAHEQYKRDRKVDTRIVDILRMRWIECLRYHGHDQAERCEDLRKVFQENETNWFIKCKSLGVRLRRRSMTGVCRRRGHIHVPELLGGLLQAGPPADLGATPGGGQATQAGGGAGMSA